MCGSMTRRVEITVSEGTWDALEAARGHEPRASFVKRALGEKLGSPPRVSQVVAGRVLKDTPAEVRGERSLAPKSVPGVRPAREFVLDPRQAALNKAKKA